ncbi:MAG: AAA family ATPase [Aquiluna sp.]|nr:AAA family ATPase [Aquiluna sp.]
MLEILRLDKFQGFGEPQEIPLRPLTLIYGPNASGKSSIIRAIRLLTQSAETFGPYGSASFQFEGRLISLASFANAVHQHDEESEISLGVTFGTPSRRVNDRPRGVRDLVSRVDAEWRISSASNIVGIKLRIWPDVSEQPPAGSSNLPEFLDLVFEPKDDYFVVSTHSGVQLLDEWARIGGTQDGAQSSKGRTEGTDGVYSSNRDWEWSEVVEQAKFRLNNLMPLYLNNRGTDFPEPELETDSLFPPRSQGELISRLMDACRATLLRLGFGFSFIGPLRKIEKRITFSEDLSNGRRERSIKGANLQDVNDAISDMLSTLTDGRYTFKPMEFQAEAVGFLGLMKSQTIVDNLTGTQVTFEDVGVGLSQVLPILKELGDISYERAPLFKTLAIEQPELHLHPKMQAGLADLFVKAVKQRDRLQIIAETHSETFLLHVQKRLREGAIDPEKVQVLFVDKGTDGNIVIPIQLDEQNDFAAELPISFSGLRLSEYL